MTNMRRMLSEEERELILELNCNSREEALKAVKSLEPENGSFSALADTVIKQTIALLEEMTDDEYLEEVLL